MVSDMIIAGLRRGMVIGTRQNAVNIHEVKMLGDSRPIIEVHDQVQTLVQPSHPLAYLSAPENRRLMHSITLPELEQLPAVFVLALQPLGRRAVRKYLQAMSDQGVSAPGAGQAAPDRR